MPANSRWDLIRVLRVKSAGASVQSTTGSRAVRISGSNAGYTTFRGSVKGTGYPLHSPVSPSLPLPRVTVCHHVSTGFCLHSSGRDRGQLPNLHMAYAVLQMPRMLESALQAKILICYLSMYVQHVTVLV